MGPTDRCSFPALPGAGTAAAALRASIGPALAIPASTTAGTLRDIGHIVVPMQDNHSFGRYPGTLDSVRGFGAAHGGQLPNEIRP